jgi:multiple sugar transport system substrate-binding protein
MSELDGEDPLGEIHKMSSELSVRDAAKLKILALNLGGRREPTVVFGGAIRERFEETHRDVSVTVKGVLYADLYDEIVAAMSTGETEYDILMIDNIWVPEFVEAGWLVDMTEFFTPEVKQNIVPRALEASEYPTGSGRYYGWLSYVDTKYLLYNKELLRKAGIKTPPKTLDELWSQSMVLKKKGIVKYPVAWNWAQKECLICDYTILTALFGGRLVDETGKPIFNKCGAVDALRWMIKSIEEGITSWASLAFAEVDMVRALGAKDAAFALCWLPEYEDVNHPEVLAGACGITHVPGSSILPEGISVNGSGLLGISSNSLNKDAAVDFIKFWAGLDTQTSYAKWLFPSWMRIFDTPKIFRGGIYDIEDTVTYQYARMITRPRIPQYAVFSKELQLAIHEALTKLKTPEEALNDAVKRLAT